MNIKPLADRVLVEIEEVKEVTKSGIILTGNVKQDSKIAKVVAVGSGIVDGKETKMEVSVNDRVILNQYSGTQVKADDKEYFIVKQSEILAKID